MSSSRVDEVVPEGPSPPGEEKDSPSLVRQVSVEQVGIPGADEIRKMMVTAPGLRRAVNVESMIEIMKASGESRGERGLPKLRSGGVAWLTEKMLTAFAQYSKLAKFSAGELVMVSKPQGTAETHSFHFVLSGNVCVLTNRENAASGDYETTERLGEGEAFGWRALGGKALYAEEVTFIAETRVETLCMSGSMVERVKRLGGMQETMVKDLIVHTDSGDSVGGDGEDERGGMAGGRDAEPSTGKKEDAQVHAPRTPEDAQLRHPGSDAVSPGGEPLPRSSPFAAAVSPVAALTEALGHTWEHIQEDNIHELLHGKGGKNVLQVLSGLQDFEAASALVIQRYWRGYVHRRARHWVGLSRQLDRLGDLMGSMSRKRGIVSGTTEDLVDGHNEGKLAVDSALSDSSKAMLRRERFRQSVYGPQELRGRIQYGWGESTVSPDNAPTDVGGAPPRIEAPTPSPPAPAPPSTQRTPPFATETTPTERGGAGVADYRLPPKSPFSGAVNSASMALDSYETRMSLTRPRDANTVPSSAPAPSLAPAPAGRPFMGRQPVFEPNDPVSKIRHVQEYSQRSLLGLKDEDAKLSGRIVAEREMMNWAKEQIAVLQERLDSSATMFEQQRARHAMSFEVATAIGQHTFHEAQAKSPPKRTGHAGGRVGKVQQRVLTREEVSVANLRRQPRRPSAA